MWSTARRGDARPSAADARNINRRSGGPRHGGRHFERHIDPHVEQQLADWTSQRARANAATKISAPLRSNTPRRPTAVIDGVVINFAIIDAETAPGRNSGQQRKSRWPRIALPQFKAPPFKWPRLGLAKFNWLRLKGLRDRVPAAPTPPAKLPQVSRPQISWFKSWWPRVSWPRPMFRWMAAGFALGVAFWHFVGFWDFISHTVLPTNRLPLHSRSNFSQPPQVTSSAVAAPGKISVSPNIPSLRAARRPSGDRDGQTPRSSSRKDMSPQQTSQNIGRGTQHPPHETATMVKPGNLEAGDVAPGKPKWAPTVRQTTSNW